FFKHALGYCSVFALSYIQVFADLVLVSALCRDTMDIHPDGIDAAIEKAASIPSGKVFINIGVWRF
ncbi:MAG: hypothetical protein K2P42_12975, partial [Lachnospiraceae bacterium]|nr:hypothetical protein [Lachnospiraceae bacterium]